MTCREVAEFLHDYIAGEMPAALVADFERHLDVCSNCREFLAQYRATITASAAAWRDEAMEDVPPELVSAILTTLQRT